jgi:DNA polymerase-3 subunit epsilon
VADAISLILKLLPAALTIRLARIDEKEAHEAYLEGLAKAAKKPAVWNN